MDEYEGITWVDRAVEKYHYFLQHWENEPKPKNRIGSAVANSVIGFVLIAVILLANLGAATQEAQSGAEAFGSAVGKLTIIVLLIVWIVRKMNEAWRSAFNNSPEKALGSFFQLVASGSMDNAARLVLSADFDHAWRMPPTIDGLGVPKEPHQFSKTKGFSAYWKALLRSHSFPYCDVRLKNVHSEEVAHGVAIVRCQVKIVRNSYLWILLLIPTLFMSIILGFFTRKTASFDIQKVMIKVGTGWKLFNGELQGADDSDLSWLR